MLTEQQLTDIRRHLGFGPIGNQNSPLLQGGTFVGYRYFQVQGQLEFRLINLSATEEIMLVGDSLNPNSVNIYPNYLDPDLGVVINGYLNICNVLESKIGTATDNLDTTRGGEWIWNKDEVANRIGLYRYWCDRMAQALYVGQGHALSPSFKSHGNLVN